jgi:hypothetical protein
MIKLPFKSVGVAAALLVATGISINMAWAITAFTPANQPIGYVSQDDMTNYDLTSGNEYVFRGNYEKQYWGGNLVAYQVGASGDVTTASQPWNGGAAYQIDLQGAGSRYIGTLKSDGTKIPFQWGSLSTGTVSQQTDLVSTAVLDYLRGVRTGEVQKGGKFRQRLSPMGDVVHSRPLYVSDAGSSTPQPTVFVGANDGMLHAINADMSDTKSGSERWAYVPSMLIPKMAKLSVDPTPSDFPHDYYVDGSMAVGITSANSMRVLVGALGGGGKGLYALNITGSSRLAPTSESSAADNALWEITPTDITYGGVKTASSAYTNLGYTYANPSIVKVGTTDAVIVGNGYNNGGDYQAYLYIINAETGALISAVKAGTSGTAASPNGLSTPVAVAGDKTDGSAGIVYAGDLNGTMWKFDLTTSPVTVTSLLTTSPAQPITVAPGVSSHPSGGYMVNFATGAMLNASDATDTSVFSVYGVWDGNPKSPAPTALLSQTLTERCYGATGSAAPSPCTSRVRTVTSTSIDWALYKAWKVNLPAGEKVVGDGSYISNGRYYFTSYDPTKVTNVCIPAAGSSATSCVVGAAGTTTAAVNGENWLMELNYLTGGSASAPFLDMNGSPGTGQPPVVDDNDRVSATTSPWALDMTTNGIPVGRFLSVGVMSQPVLVQLVTLNNTFLNQNPDSTPLAIALGTAAGVAGGHFDVDIFYAPPAKGARATATLTIGTTSQISGVPASLGDITVNGVVISPAMGITDGNNANANAIAIAANINSTSSGFTAKVKNNVVTITSPITAKFNSKGISVTSVPSTYVAAQGDYPTGTIVFNNTNKTSGGGASMTVAIGGINGSTVINLGKSQVASSSASSFIKAWNNSAVAGISAYPAGNSVSKACSSMAVDATKVCLVDQSSNNSNRTITISNPTGFSGGQSPTASNMVGGPYITATGLTDFSQAISTNPVPTFDSKGVDAGSVGDTCTGTDCKYDTHYHQYDDVYDVTGVNVINPSSAKLNISLGIPILSQQFKIIVQNQYLNPAVKLNFGHTDYLYNVDFGYTSVKDYNTSSTIDLATLQTYVRDPSVVWTGSSPPTADQLKAPKPISNLVFNMPLDALTPKNWWGNGDIRVGLIPMEPGCMWQAQGANDGNMYQPIIPPANGTDGPGKMGWDSTTTPTTATGVRHGGALILQLIRADTPNDAVELNLAGRPEYGWRVKSSEYSKWVLMEYGTYWHHPNQLCFYDNGWTKSPGADNGSSTTVAKAAGSTDPVLGNLSAGSAGTGSISTISTVVVGNVTTTTITYINGATATIVSTVSNDKKTVTIVTTDAQGTQTTQTILNTGGSLISGGNESKTSSGTTRRISWRELVSP